MNVVNKVTLKTLRKNKTRTIVTIIGVILSAAMITAVTTFISSMQRMMINAVTASDGPWQAALTDIPYRAAREESENVKIAASGIRRSLGYARLEGSKNEDKPYLYLQEMDASSMDLYALHVTEGRLPQTPDELMIPLHVAQNGGVEFSLGDSLILSPGIRTGADGENLGQNDAFRGEAESYREGEPRTYTVVGFYKRPKFEPYSAPGFTAISALDTAALADDAPVDLTYVAKNVRDAVPLAQSFLEENRLPDTQYNAHSDLLDYMGVSMRSGFNAILYSMGTILIILIMVGSISLIYNAFAISVSERSRQFGMLAGVGATSRQIRNSIFFEAGFISMIGIPIGILSGIGGIGVTLYLLRGVFDSFLNFTDSGGGFVLSVSVPAVIIAAAVGFVTVLISAWIPARRAARVSPIEAIRQSNDVKIKSRQVKTSRLTRLLFGIEGDLAMKNFKRNRRRYRATVFSLVISIVLFLSASSFSSYMSEGTDTAYADINYDLSISLHSYDDEQTAVIKDTVDGLPLTERTAVSRGVQGCVAVDPSLIRAPLRENALLATGETMLQTYIVAVDDREMRDYVESLGLRWEDYNDPAYPLGVAVDTLRYYDQSGMLQGGRLFASRPKDAITLRDYSYMRAYTEEERIAVPSSAIGIGALSDQTPLGVTGYNSDPTRFTLVVSDTVYDAAFSAFDDAPLTPALVVTSSDPNQLEKEIQTALQSKGISNAYIMNIADQLQISRNLMLVVNVFSYGFITLITLITIANVFNTISTNVNLRRREFAMMKSVGMTGGGFNRMINFECLFYGLKALLYGLPLSLLVTWLIYRAMNSGIGLAFRIPWMHLLICIIGVFVIVFITMMYAMSKVRKENIVDALKNENL